MISHTCGNNKFGIQSPQYTFNARLMLRYCCQAQEIPQEEVLGMSIIIKENKERGSCGNGRLLIHLHYSAVTGNRKQVLTGSSESCEHKCR